MYYHLSYGITDITSIMAYLVSHNKEFTRLQLLNFQCVDIISEFIEIPENDKTENNFIREYSHLSRYKKYV